MPSKKLQEREHLFQQEKKREPENVTTQHDVIPKRIYIEREFNKKEKQKKEKSDQ